MYARILAIRFPLVCLILAIALPGAVPRIGLDPLPDDPQPGREAIEEGLKKRRAFVHELEEFVQFHRDEVKLQLNDAVAGQQGAVLKAKKELLKAKVAREEAEYHVQEYVLGIYVQDKATYRGQIALAMSDLERAIDRLQVSTDLLRMGKVSTEVNIADQLRKQQAEFDYEEARMQLDVLEKYTKDKETKKRQAAVAAAEALEAEKKGLLEVEQARETRVREMAEQLRVRSPEDLVLALIDDAVQSEGKVVAIIGEAQKIEAQIRDKPEQAATLNEKLVAKKAEITSHMNQAKSQLLEAANLAEKAKSLRAKLREAEARFRREREILDRLEAEFAKKP